MRYWKLGNSDLNVSEIALGSWLTYGVGVELDTARACVDQAFELGINFIDTANVYGRGAAETMLGEILESRTRDSYILATKLFFPMDDEGTNKGLSAQQVHKQCEDSLERLGVDYFDLYQCHRFDPTTPLEETTAALTELVESGKVRYIGFSEWNAKQIQAVAEIPNVERFVSSQPEYSILQRRIEAEVIPLCEELGIGQIVWSPLAQGILTGKYKPGAEPPSDSRAASGSMNWGIDPWLKDEKRLAAVQDLKPIADGLGISMAQMALAWVLRQPNVSSAIIGASRPEQIVENVAATEISLEDSTLAQIDAAVGPYVER